MQLKVLLVACLPSDWNMNIPLSSIIILSLKGAPEHLRSDSFWTTTIDVPSTWAIFAFSAIPVVLSKWIEPVTFPSTCIKLLFSPSVVIVPFTQDIVFPCSYNAAAGE